MQENKIYCIDVLQGLKKLDDESIDCIVTSPPYWALRDYNSSKQIGLEDNPQDYINKIVEIMKECKRVLNPNGTIWLNLGDLDPALPAKADRIVDLLHQARTSERPIRELIQEAVGEVAIIHLGGYRDAIELQKPDRLPQPKPKKKK